MLKTRIITGVFIAAVLLLVMIFSHIPWVLRTAIVCLSLQTIYEFYGATGLKKNKPLCFISCAAAILLSVVTIPGFNFLIFILFAVAISLFIYLMRNVEKLNGIKPWIAVCVAAMILCFFKCGYEIRAMDNGVYLLGMTVLVPIITDVAAYFVGRGCGRHKLAPTISPKKTIEGSIGGIVNAVVLLILVATILRATNVLSINYGILMAYLILASIVGQFGDLALSSVKRIVRIKDYGDLLPGHGGILDRVDSLLFVLPFTYLFCLYAAPMLV